MLLTVLFIAVASFSASATENDSITSALRGFINQALTFTERMPREKVSLHLDNTGYFRGDKIWFQCYVVDGIAHTPTVLSNTLYVELLNPRGKVISRQILKIENGRCHGAFTLTHLPFYSGFYEVRAYTKYMLNFGDEAVYSRVIPVFDSPKTAGDFSEMRMARNISRYPGKRPTTKSGPRITMRFFPEGGSLIDGVAGRVAFEITGRGGVAVEASGRVVDKLTGRTVATIRTIHEGRGLFEFTPDSSGDYQAIITSGNGGSEQTFKLPAVRDNGVGLNVDYLSNPDSILVTIRPSKEARTTKKAGMAISSRGGLWCYTMVDLSRNHTLKFSSREMPSGVGVITLFGPDGHTLAERMIFINNGGYGQLETTLDKSTPEPQGIVRLDITATDADGKAAQQLPLSVAVADAEHAVDTQSALLSDLLLMSEMKGYVSRPMQYFQPNDSIASRRNLDLLMMVRGWRCYSWEEMSGINPIGLRYYPEQGIDMDGQVVSFVRGIPKPNVDLSVMISAKDVPDSLRQSFTDIITTDSCGRFTLSYDFYGKWNLVMSASENGKKKDHRVMFDRLFSPSPRQYQAAEMSVDNPDTSTTLQDAPVYNPDSIAQEVESFELLQSDTNGEKTLKLHEVVVKGKRNRDADIYKARSKSLIYYDLQEEISDLTDNGQLVGNDLFDVLRSINPDFQRRYTQGQEKIYYKTRKPLFVINYNRSYKRDSLNHTLLYPENIKSIFISEDPGIMLKYADPVYNMFNIDHAYSCAVFVETFSEPKGPVARGTRFQTVEGYTLPEEFSNINDPALLDDPDFRRTLYWNPLLITGSDGKAHIEFLNNSTSRKFRITVQGLSSDGTLYSNW